MMKFLTTNKCNQYNQDNTDIILTQSKTQNNNLHNVINPNDVKLLSDDNAGIDFLTLCTMKKSEEEMSSDTVYRMNTTYIPLKPVKDLFNFIVPDIKIIDSFLTKLRDCDGSLTQHKNCENNLSVSCANTKTNNDCINIDSDDDNNSWHSIRNEERADEKEIKFEDILDESSDSNEIPISHLSQKITNIEIDTINKVSIPNVESDNKSITNVETKISIDMLDNTGPSIFENILNESFTSTEDDLENKETAQPDTISPNSLNASAIDIEKVTKNTYKNIVNVFCDENNINRSDQNLSVSEKFVGSSHANKSARSFMDDMQDFDFNSDDDINGFIRSEFEKNKSKIDYMCNSKAQESLLSITQAIDEIAQMKKNPKRLLKSSKEESIDSTSWISVNNKCEIKTGNTKSGIRLSNINHNFMTKSHPVRKQESNFLNDSDEDFMITEDNVKKFDELESSYFRDASKNSANSNNLPGTSRNTEIKDSFYSVSKNSEAENSWINNSYINNISRNLRLCDMSILHSRRPGLSLNKNKRQYSNVIDLTASNRDLCNTRDKNISESNVDTSRETSVLAKNIKQKIKHKKKKSKDIIKKNEFIDDEAEVDADVSSDESIIIMDEEDNNFVSYTQNSQDQIDMQAHYLQTVKSPIKRPGDFHFRRPRSSDSDEEIYSQSLSQAQDAYLYVCKISNAL